MSNGIALVIESLVAVLLALTIGYCWLLNRRLLKLRSDESALKATIAELVTATDIAGRAISGLKQADSSLRSPSFTQTPLGTVTPPGARKTPHITGPRSV